MNESLISAYRIPDFHKHLWYERVPLDPFTLSHPTAVQTSLFAGALFAKFDPTGRFIASGRLNGSAEIWDLETRAPIRWLDGHVKAITSIECVLLSLFKITVGLRSPIAGRGILGISWRLQKTGTSSFGIFLLHMILHNDKNPSVLMSQLLVPRSIPKIGEKISRNICSFLTQQFSQIVLVLLATGEAYVCDLRKQNRSRTELLETLPDEVEEDEENAGQGTSRCVRMRRYTIIRIDWT